MRKLFHLLPFLLAGMILFVGCDDDDNNNNESPDPVTFTINVTAATFESASVEVTPSDADATYFAGLVPTADIENLDNAAIIELLKSSEGFDGRLVTGERTYNFDNLTENTEYTVLAFSYIDDVAGELAKKEFTTPEEGRVAVTFLIEVTDITTDAAIATIKPSDPEADYYAGYVPASEIEGLDDTAVIGKMMSATDFDQNIFKDEKTLDLTDLFGSTEYSVLAFSYINGVAGDLCIEKFTTEQVDFMVGIAISEIEGTSAVIDFTPNIADTKYFGRVYTANEFDHIDPADRDANIIEYSLQNPNREEYTYTGNKTLAVERLQPGVKYLVVAFDFYDSNRKLFKQEFSTLNAQEGDQFAISNLKIGHTSISLRVTPDNDSQHWYWSLMEKKDYDQYGSPIVNAYYGLHNRGIVEGGNIQSYLQARALTGEQDIAPDDAGYSYGITNDTEYVLMIFYVDLGNSDPTNVYDMNYTKVEFKTLAPDEGSDPEVTVADPVVTKNGSNWDVSINVKVNKNVTSIRWATQTYASVAAYMDLVEEEGWGAIKAFFFFSDQNAYLEQAASAEGYDKTWTNWTSSYNYVFLVEVKNEEGVIAYDGVHIDPALYFTE